ncbi:hypothetical protein V8F44DRAFT_618787 [Aspergillus fumigatus]
MEKLLSPISCSLHTALESLAGQLGTYFQIRDDYKNLTEEYTSQKDFCKDLNSRSPWSMLCLPGPTTSICEESCNNLG